MHGYTGNAQIHASEQQQTEAFFWSLGPFDKVDGWAKRLQDLYAYWRTLPRNTLAGVPLRSNFDPFAVRSAIGWLWLCDVEGTPLRLRYRLVGTSIVQTVRADATGKWMDELSNSYANRSVDMSRFEATIQNREATYSKGPPVFDPSNFIDAVEVLCLPVSQNGTVIDQLMCCSAYYRDGRNVPLGN